MKFAMLIEHQSDAWRLTFPDVPGYVKTARVANTLLASAEDRLYEALHEHVTQTGDLPDALHEEGVVIHVRPIDAARLALLRGLHQLDATDPETVAVVLDIGVLDATQVLDPREWVDANSVFRYLEERGVTFELSFGTLGAELPPATRPPAVKKRGRVKAGS